MLKTTIREQLNVVGDPDAGAEWRSALAWVLLALVAGMGIDVDWPLEKSDE